MKAHDKKSQAPGVHHQEHVQLLNALTESLKDELKRGLTLLDGCVNQLAQAKWILINVERTIENFYKECPACDEEIAAPPVGNRATSPPSVVPTPNNPSTSTKKPRESKAKKASVLPMVSGHTVQRPNINIARVDVRKAKKPKKEKEPTSTSRVRNRGSGSTALALLTASNSTGRPIADSGDEASRNGTNGTAAAKKKPGPMSKTRIRSETRPDFTYDGVTVSVNLEDVEDLLCGETNFQGTELNKFLKLAGLPLIEPPKPKAASSKSVKASSSRSKEDSKNKRKHDTDTSDLSDQESTKKKAEDTKATSSKDVNPTGTPKLTPSSIPLDINSRIRSTFLKFAQGKLGAVAGSKDSKTESKETPQKKTATSADSISVKTEADSDDSDNGSKFANKATSKKKSRNSSSGSDSDYPPKSKRTKQTRRDSQKNASDDESSPTGKISKTSKKAPSSKKKVSSDEDSDEGGSLASKSKPKRRNIVGPRSAKNKSREAISSDSEDDGSTVSNNKKGKSNRKPLRGESPAGSINSKKSIKSPERRTSKDETRKKTESPERRSNAGSKFNNSDNDEPKPKPRPGPASAKAKRTGGRPGPMSAKLKAEKEKEAENNHSSDDGNKKSDKTKNKSQAMFSDDSDDSEIKKIKKSFPLDLQDAARSPSPQASKDVFANLLSAYNPPPETPIGKLKKKSKQIKPEVFELKSVIQDKLSEVGRELVPYMGPVEADEKIFTPGKYYIVGSSTEEKLVLFDSTQELQELDLSMEDVDELLED